MSNETRSPITQEIDSMYHSIEDLCQTIAILNEKLQLVMRPIPVKEDTSAKEYTNSSPLLSHLKIINKNIIDFNMSLTEIIENVDL